MAEYDRQVFALELIHEAYAQSRRPRVTDIVHASLGDDVQATIQTATPRGVTSGTIVVRTAGVTRVYLAGVGSTVQARRVALGYANRLLVRQAGGFNYFVAEDGRALFDDLVYPELRPGDRLEVYGHSAGGAVAEVMAKRAQGLYPDMDIYLDTFGAPCPGLPGACLSPNDCTRNRWMHNNDPVPLLPWADLGTGSFLVLWLFGQVGTGGGMEDLRPQDFVQPAGGRRISLRTLTVGNLPVFTVSQQAQMSAWLNQSEEASDQHDAGTYLIVMRTIRASYPEGLPPVVRQLGPTRAPVEVLDVVMPFELPFQRQQFVAMPIAIRPDGVALDVAGVPIGTFSIGAPAMPFLKINPKLAFRRVKVGNSWHVAIGDNVVMICDEPRVPRTIVKRLNGMLRAVGTENTVFLTAFLAGLQEWLTGAVGGAPYCVPAMRVDP